MFALTAEPEEKMEIEVLSQKSLDADLPGRFRNVPELKDEMTKGKELNSCFGTMHQAINKELEKLSAATFHLSTTEEKIPEYQQEQLKLNNALSIFEDEKKSILDQITFVCECNKLLALDLEEVKHLFEGTNKDLLIIISTLMEELKNSQEHNLKLSVTVQKQNDDLKSYQELADEVHISQLEKKSGTIMQYEEENKNLQVQTLNLEQNCSFLKQNLKQEILNKVLALENELQKLNDVCDSLKNKHNLNVSQVDELTAKKISLANQYQLLQKGNQDLNIKLKEEQTRSQKLISKTQLLVQELLVKSIEVAELKTNITCLENQHKVDIHKLETEKFALSQQLQQSLATADKFSEAAYLLEEEKLNLLNSLDSEVKKSSTLEKRAKDLEYLLLDLEEDLARIENLHMKTLENYEVKKT